MQAARGTSVATGSRRRALGLLAVVFAFAYGTDQVSKAVALARLDGGEDVQVVGDLLRLHLTRNPGAAFSAGTDYTPFLTALAVVATLVVLWVARKVRSAAWGVTFGLLLAGIAGNLTDRLARDPEPFHGHVIDFLRLPNWPIFNVADICINVGAALVLLLTFRGVQLDGTRHRRGDDADTTDTTETDPDADPHADPDPDDVDEESAVEQERA